MRAYVPAYELRVPASMREALELMAREPGVWRPFAGGTDLMVLLEAGALAHRQFFSVRHLGELRGVEESPNYVTLGALTTYTEVRRHAALAREFPMMCRAAEATGGVAIQNRGTLGGNIANASPAADTPPALLAYDAELELVSAAGARRVAYKDFHTGYKQTVARPDELVARIHLPRANGARRHYYRKVGTRKAQAISKVCFAATASVAGGELRDVRVSLGSVAPTPVRCFKTEAALKDRRPDAAALNEARAALAGEIAPIDDLRSTRNYRLRVALNLLEDFLSELGGKN
ncbi:MAG TPA: xanthine dehydrogenase family protein subunit M [Pyrinomonadaceae bacterium]|nr:xanthine dehydrogenase family protein subunit M [Pyrinomonadaceae bacterium]